MYGRPKVLLLGSEPDERDSLGRVLSERATLRSVGTLPELQAALEEETYAAFFCGWSFQSGDWNLALIRARHLVPDLPVIVFCRTGGEVEWIRVLKAGAFDLLAPPYCKGTVFPVLEHAVASHEARRMHRFARVN